MEPKSLFCLRLAAANQRFAALARSDKHGLGGKRRTHPKSEIEAEKKRKEAERKKNRFNTGDLAVDLANENAYVMSKHLAAEKKKHKSSRRKSTEGVAPTEMKAMKKNG